MTVFISFFLLFSLGPVLFRKAVNRFVKPNVLEVEFETFKVTLQVRLGFVRSYVISYGTQDFKSKKYECPHSMLAYKIYKAWAVRKKKLSKKLFMKNPILGAECLSLNVKSVRMGSRCSYFLKPEEDNTKPVINSPFKILGLQEGASKEIVRDRYLALIKISHPDVNPNISPEYAAALNDSYNKIMKE